jgi:hypothetical protein
MSLSKLHSHCHKWRYQSNASAALQIYKSLAHHHNVRDYAAESSGKILITATQFQLNGYETPRKTRNGPRELVADSHNFFEPSEN